MAKIKVKQADKMANGLVILIFGFLFLLIQLRIIDHWLWLTYLKQPPTFFLVAGVISVWLKREKALGYILTGIGVIGYSDIFLNWTSNYTPYTQYTFPVIVMIAGILLIVSAKR